MEILATALQNKSVVSFRVNLEILNHILVVGILLQHAVECANVYITNLGSASTKTGERVARLIVRDVAPAINGGLRLYIGNCEGEKIHVIHLPGFQDGVVYRVGLKCQNATVRFTENLL